MGRSPSPKIVQFSSRYFTYANFTLPPGESSVSEERASATVSPTPKMKEKQLRIAPGEAELLLLDQSPAA
ncbi:hypothetical protein Poly59_15280 [Rubripirellula reticaptiva]|uniref:Uncharacterized protein n=1 Tax=Rubripirellula reticaptiva TaxID=2528013 RepID=A0A5C6F6U1_9BACT|nr:hypothetical protein Poly59_15280 [Rubripirellula reticaptiva]